jgi:hypothetical protein
MDDLRGYWYPPILGTPQLNMPRSCLRETVGSAPTIMMPRTLGGSHARAMDGYGNPEECPEK